MLPAGSLRFSGRIPKWSWDSRGELLPSLEGAFILKRFFEFRLTIGAKLAGLIAVVLIGSVASLVWLSSRMFIEENTSLIQKTNSDLVRNLASGVHETLQDLVDKMHLMGSIIRETRQSPVVRDTVLSQYYGKDKEFMGLFLVEHGSDGRPTLIERSISPELARIGDEKGDGVLAALGGKEGFSLSQLATGEVQMAPLLLADNSLALALGIPFVEREGRSGFSESLVAIFRQSIFARAFSENETANIFLVDGRGRLLAHPDSTRVIAGEDMSRLDIVKKMREGTVNNAQMRYLDPSNGQTMLGAFHLVGFNGLGVVAEVPLRKALEPVWRVEYRALLIGGVVLFLGFLAGYLYSRTISWPIRQLVDVARRISAGDFDVRIQPKSRDEVAHLSLAFNEMARGLAERDKVKEAFRKFHSREIAEKIMSGTLKLGGTRRDAVIFFSDIRGFTAMSERIQPELIVKILNTYMTEMVKVITQHGGVVDKYVGDAIMAVWGVPESKATDCDNAIMACLGMRAALERLNARLEQEGLPPLWIGMGLNFGSVISGNIGSEERMEFTVIGDAVNTASRVESLTKEFGTDLLVSHDVLRQIQGAFLVDKVHEALVKGKKEPLTVYKVLGYQAKDGSVVRVETRFSSYRVEKRKAA